mmetsp:Transcript_2523/g.5977  ORF Transcript_2523/g.5977 Transcript_2523/m.5977 type:complete len:298 (-) Transcript_2523:114-1007(-)
MMFTVHREVVLRVNHILAHRPSETNRESGHRTDVRDGLESEHLLEFEVQVRGRDGAELLITVVPHLAGVSKKFVGVGANAWFGEMQLELVRSRAAEFRAAAGLSSRGQCGSILEFISNLILGLIHSTLKHAHATKLSLLSPSVEASTNFKRLNVLHAADKLFSRGRIPLLPTLVNCGWSEVTPSGRCVQGNHIFLGGVAVFDNILDSHSHTGFFAVDDDIIVRHKISAPLEVLKPDAEHPVHAVSLVTRPKIVELTRSLEIPGIVASVTHLDDPLGKVRLQPFPTRDYLPGRGPNLP